MVWDFMTHFSGECVGGMLARSIEIRWFMWGRSGKNCRVWRTIQMVIKPVRFVTQLYPVMYNSLGIHGTCWHKNMSSGRGSNACKRRRKKKKRLAPCWRMPGAVCVVWCTYLFPIAATVGSQKMGKWLKNSCIVAGDGRRRAHWAARRESLADGFHLSSSLRQCPHVCLWQIIVLF